MAEFKENKEGKIDELRGMQLSPRRSVKNFKRLRSTWYVLSGCHSGTFHIYHHRTDIISSKSSRDDKTLEPALSELRRNRCDQCPTASFLIPTCKLCPSQVSHAQAEAKLQQELASAVPV